MIKPAQLSKIGINSRYWFGLKLVAGSFGTSVFLASLLHAAPDVATNTPASTPTNTSASVLAQLPPDATAKEALSDWSIKTREALIAEWSDKYSNSADAQVLIGDAYRIAGNSAQARKHWEQTVQIDRSRADVYYKLGVLAAETGDDEKTVEHWQKALSIKPNMPGLKWRMASELLDLGRHDEAIKILNEEVAASPDNVSAWYLLGQANLELHHTQEALDAYSKVIQISPDHAGAHYGLSTVYTRLSQPDKAREHRAIFDQLKARQLETHKTMEAAENKPSLAALNLGQLLFDAHQFYKTQHDYSRAGQVLNQAIQLKPENAEYRLALAALYSESGRLEDALKVCDDILRFEPQNRFCYLNIGILTGRLNRFEESEKAFRHAIELGPRSPEGYQQLARLFVKRETNLPEAKSLAQTAVDLKPNAENYFLLAWVCDRTGDAAHALESIQAALRLDPGKQRYQELYGRIKQHSPKI